MEKRSGWSSDFDIQSIPGWLELENAIRKNKEKCEEALRKRSEEILKKRQEEVDRLKGQLNELMCKAQLKEAPVPKYVEAMWCPCMNDGHGGIVID